MLSAQVATEWLFACPKDVLDRHLHGSTPASPAAHAQDRVTTPRRVGLTVSHHSDHTMPCPRLPRRSM